MKHSFVAICLSALTLSTRLRNEIDLSTSAQRRQRFVNDLEAVSGCFGYLIAN